MRQPRRLPREAPGQRSSLQELSLSRSWSLSRSECSACVNHQSVFLYRATSKSNQHSALAAHNYRNSQTPLPSPPSRSVSLLYSLQLGLWSSSGC